MIGTDEGTGTGDRDVDKGERVAAATVKNTCLLPGNCSLLSTKLFDARPRSRAEPVDGHSLRKHIREGPAPFRRPPSALTRQHLKAARRSMVSLGKIGALGRLGTSAAEGLQGDSRDDGEGGRGGASRRRGQGRSPRTEKPSP